jgi:hypothetical protein
VIPVPAQCPAALRVVVGVKGPLLFPLGTPVVRTGISAVRTARSSRGRDASGCGCRRTPHGCDRSLLLQGGGAGPVRESAGSAMWPAINLGATSRDEACPLTMRSPAPPAHHGRRRLPMVGDGTSTSRCGPSGWLGPHSFFLRHRAKAVPQSQRLVPETRKSLSSQNFEHCGVGERGAALGRP